MKRLVVELYIDEEGEDLTVSAEWADEMPLLKRLGVLQYAVQAVYESGREEYEIDRYKSDDDDE